MGIKWGACPCRYHFTNKVKHVRFQDTKSHTHKPHIRRMTFRQQLFADALTCSPLYFLNRKKKYAMQSAGECLTNICILSYVHIKTEQCMYQMHDLHMYPPTVTATPSNSLYSLQWLTQYTAQLKSKTRMQKFQQKRPQCAITNFSSSFRQTMHRTFKPYSHINNCVICL